MFAKLNLPILIIGAFLLIFVFKSITTMLTAPFYDFDEAHRAENARRMLDHGSYLVPITGSSQDRVDNLKIPFKFNPNLNIYYHLERPGLVYWLMMGSSKIFGDREFSYRLPSFLLGFGAILIFISFAKNIISPPRSPPRNELVDSRFIGNNRVLFPALLIGLLSLITSTDLWLSSQYAQLDTGITFFLFLALLTLISFSETKNSKYLKVSALSFAMAVLSKGAPAIIFGVPIFALLILRKISLKDILKFIIYSFIILIPWIILLSTQFSFKNVLEIFSKFALNSSSVPFIHIKAPIYWYVRWWFESLRPGFVVFLSLVLMDLVKRNLNWKKITLLSYIFGGLIFFSLLVNKVWWYILPLVPALAYYIYISVSNYLKESPKKLLNLSLILILASLPVFLNSTNKIALGFGFAVSLLSFVLLNLDLSKFWKFSPKIVYFTFLLAAFYSLLAFTTRFPAITPYAVGVKEVASKFPNIEGHKCLWVYHLPAEAVLFYSNAGQVNELNPDSPDSILYKSCINNYLITPLDISDKDFNFISKKELLYKKGNISLIKISQKVN